MQEGTVDAILLTVVSTGLQRFAMILTHAVLLLTCWTQRELLSSQTSLPSNLNASTQCLVGQLHCKALYGQCTGSTALSGSARLYPMARFRPAQRCSWRPWRLRSVLATRPK